MSRILAKMRSRRWTHNDYTELDLYDMDRNPLDLSGGGGDPTPPPEGGGEDSKITVAVATSDTTYSAGDWHPIQFHGDLSFTPVIDLGATVSTTSPTVTIPERGLYFLRGQFGFSESPYAKGSLRDLRIQDVGPGGYIDGTTAIPVQNSTGVGQTLLDFSGHHELDAGQVLSLCCRHNDYESYAGSLGSSELPDGYFGKLEIVLVRRIPAAT